MWGDTVMPLENTEDPGVCLSVCAWDRGWMVNGFEEASRQAPFPHPGSEPAEKQTQGLGDWRHITTHNNKAGFGKSD